MTIINLPDYVPVEDTAPKTMGGRPFPCDANGWTKHTGMIVGASIKSFDSGDSISMRVENGNYAGEILVNLDPSGAPDPKKALETRNLALTILGQPAGKIDVAKLEKASGQLVAFAAKHKGFSHGRNGGTFHKVTLILDGEVKQLTPVTGQELMPALPGAIAGDIPF